MKRKSVAILGTIGVGKTTMMENLFNELSKTSNHIKVKAEPSVTVPFINDVLQKFYTDNGSWSLVLQLLISAAQEAHFQDLRASDYDYALFDMPYSSDIYSYSHMKQGNMSAEGHHSLVSIGSHFPFDVVILINEDKETTIKRVMSRNSSVKNNEYSEDKKDVAIEDFSYLDNHISDFKEYQDVWLGRFRYDNPSVKIVQLNHIPDLATDEYRELIKDLVKVIKGE